MRVGRGRKMKVPEIDAIVSVTCSGAAHELERASYDILDRSYALGWALPARAAEHNGTNISAASETCTDVSSTSAATAG